MNNSAINRVAESPEFLDRLWECQPVKGSLFSRLRKQGNLAQEKKETGRSRCNWPPENWLLINELFPFTEKPQQQWPQSRGPEVDVRIASFLPGRWLEPNHWDSQLSEPPAVLRFIKGQIILQKEK